LQAGSSKRVWLAGFASRASLALLIIPTPTRAAQSVASAALRRGDVKSTCRGSPIAIAETIIRDRFMVG
jgi:hypothetical protein